MPGRSSVRPVSSPKGPAPSSRSANPSSNGPSAKYFRREGPPVPLFLRLYQKKGNDRMTTSPTIEPGSITREGRIVRMAQPRNDEFDFGRLQDVITPNDEFYVRSHGPVPDVDPTSWRLEVTG